MDELCRRYQESIGDSALPEELIRHGESCEACREFTRAQQTLQRSLPSWATPDFSPNFALSVMAQIAEERARRRTFSDLLHEMMQFRLSVPLPVGALASVLFIISLLLNYAFWPLNQDGISNRSQDLANYMGAKSLTANPAAVSTPVAMAVLNENASGKGRAIESFIVPREFLGAGAFLLVPIFDPNFPGGIHQKESTDAHRGI